MIVLFFDFYYHVFVEYLFILYQKCDAFQTEIQYLTVSVSKLETDMQKKDKEIERLKKETKTVHVLQESEKDFKTQVRFVLFFFLLPTSHIFRTLYNLI